MASLEFEEIVDDFEFLDDWEDRYRFIIERAKTMPPLDEALKVPATKVEGCASQVWLNFHEKDGRIYFEGDSDAIIVRGLITVLKSLFNGLEPKDILAVDAAAELARLGLNDHLSAQRSNGVKSMVERIRHTAQLRS